MIVKAFEEGEEEGQQILTSWCKKPQIVFARTTPAQKLLIVKANQSLVKLSVSQVMVSMTLQLLNKVISVSVWVSVVVTLLRMLLI